MKPTDRCQYCGHNRSEHNRPEPGNPSPGLRCGKGCVCAAFIETDGRPDWQRRQQGHAVAKTGVDELTELLTWPSQRGAK